MSAETHFATMTHRHKYTHTYTQTENGNSWWSRLASVQFVQAIFHLMSYSSLVLYGGLKLTKTATKIVMQHDKTLF